MKKLARYILFKCLFNTLTLLFAFAIIYSIINAISELSSVGKGSYTTFAMFIYLAALLPSYIYLLIPLAVLIGVMTAMLGLVKNSEYAIMRTSGVSLVAITKILTIYGIIFATLTFTVGEIIAPESSHFAKIYKLNKMNERVSTELSSGVWSKDGEHNIINIKEIDQNDSSVISGIQIFTYNNAQQLQQYILAPTATYRSTDASWILESAISYKYLDNKILITNYPKYAWMSTIDPSYFNVLVVAPEDMPVLGLVKYIHHLKNNRQATNRHEIAMWIKLLYPISCISMSFIAVGFIPNNGRNINLSSKLFFGILIGITFFFSNKLIGFMAIIFNWNPILAAVIPTLVLFSLGAIIIYNKES